MSWDDRTPRQGHTHQWSRPNEDGIATCPCGATSKWERYCCNEYDVMEDGDRPLYDWRMCKEQS